MVPSADVRSISSRVRTAPGNDGATALRDRRIAEYEARLRDSPLRYWIPGMKDRVPVTTLGTGVLRGDTAISCTKAGLSDLPDSLQRLQTVPGPAINRGPMSSCS